MTRVVLDASVVLARLQNEAGAERAEALLRDLEQGAGVQFSISSVNWCEILTRLHRDSVSNPEAMLASLLAGVDLVPFGKEEAEAAASVATMNLALSLGDRACLALAKTLDATAWTTDKIWAKLPIGAKLEVVR